MNASDESISTVAVTERIKYLNEPPRAAISFSIAIRINEESAVISRKTYIVKISVTMTIPFIPVSASRRRLIKLKRIVSFLIEYPPTSNDVNATIAIDSNNTRLRLSICDEIFNMPSIRCAPLQKETGRKITMPA